MNRIRMTKRKHRFKRRLGVGHQLEGDMTRKGKDETVPILDLGVTRQVKAKDPDTA